MTSRFSGAPRPTADDRSVQLQVVILFMSTMAGLCFVLVRDSILPARFLVDGELIRAIALGEAEADRRYTNTAAVYGLFRLEHYPLAAYVLGYGLAVTALLVAWTRTRRSRGGLSSTVMTSLAVLLSAVYLGYYSKDVLVVPIVLAVLMLAERRRSEVVIVALMLVYAQQFRPYWFVVAGLYVGFRIIQPRVSAKWLVPLAAIATAAVSLFIVFVMGVPADSFRTSVNEFRTEVGTMIVPFVDLPGPLSGVVNNVITLFALMVPLPILQNGGLYYLAIAAVIAWIWLSILRVAGPAVSAGTATSRRAMALVLAFVCTQALFEPDYGSALRHLTPLLPLFVYVTRDVAVVREASPVHQ